MFLSPSAVDTGSAPPLITVPAGAVVMVLTWQTAQPIELNTAWPAVTCAVIGRRGGAFRQRMNVVNSLISPASSSPVADGSPLPSNGPPWTLVPLDVFSVLSSLLVTPISLR